MFDKPNAYGRIDGMVSLAMATGVALCRSPGEERLQRQNSYFRSMVTA